PPQSRCPAGIAGPAAFRRIKYTIRMAAITQIRQRHSDSRAYYDRKIAEGKAQRGPSGPWGGRSATRSTAASGPTPAIPRKARAGALEATGNDCVARPAGSHPGLACGRGPGPRRLRDPPVSWLKSWWREENFLKYASANYGIDAICDYIAAIETNTKITGNPAR